MPPACRNELSTGGLAMQPACRNELSTGGSHYVTACVKNFKSPSQFKIFPPDPFFILYFNIYIQQTYIYLYTRNIQTTEA